MDLDRLVSRSHHPSRTLMKTWTLPTPTTIPYLSLCAKPEFFGEKTPPSISLIGAAAFKRLIDAGEEVYTINIQPTSDYLDIMALQAVGTQPAPTSDLHSEPLSTDKAQLFTKVVQGLFRCVLVRRG